MRQTRRNNQMIRSNNRCDLFRMSSLNGGVSRKLSTSAFPLVAWILLFHRRSFIPPQRVSIRWWCTRRTPTREHANTRTHVGHVSACRKVGRPPRGGTPSLGRHRGRESKFPPRLASPTSEFRLRKIRRGAQAPCPLIEPTLAITPPPLSRGAPFIRCNS